MRFFCGIVIFLGTFFSCRSGKNDITIVGEIKHLPDGVIYVVNDNDVAIDSAITKQGKFVVRLKNSGKAKYLYVSLEHLDKENNKRLFQFKTKKTRKNDMVLNQYFIPEGNTRITGELVEFVPKDFPLPKNIHLVYPSDMIVAGRQNQVLTDVNFDFNGIPNSTTIDTLKKLIIRYPYSYHLFHQITRHRNDYTSDQLSDFIKLFDADLRNSSDFTLLSKAIEIKKHNNQTILSTKLINTEEKLASVLNPTAKVNMIILWASWCRPCITEIPDLVILHDKYKVNKNINMVSVSLDANDTDWKTALNKYSMPWKQLRLQDSLVEFQNEIFQFDGSIPCIIFVDNEGNLMKKFVGYSKDNLQEYNRILAAIPST